MTACYKDIRVPFAQGIVNPAVLLSPLTTQEAVLSSRIEGTEATMAEVFELEADPKEKVEQYKREDIREIINYRNAMNLAVEEFKKLPLCLNVIKKLHSVLLDSVRGRNKNPGEFRRTQNHIGPKGCSIEEATFVPPSPEQVLPALSNWEKYLHYEEKDKLIQLAVAKAQFEIIHPFNDGNGRIGRMLIPLFLFEKGMLSSPMFYLSAFFEANREVYYERLLAITRDGNWDGWISYFLTAVKKQADDNTQKVKDILALYEWMKVNVHKAIHTQYAIQSIDALFDRPIFTTLDFTKRSHISKNSARRIIQALKEVNIISELRPGGGRRAAIYIFQELINIADRRT